jgi:acyl-CoA dehydrogenase
MHEAMAAFATEHVAPRKLAENEAFPHDLWRAMGEAGLFRIGLERGGYADIAAAEAALVEHGGAPGFSMSWAGHQMVARFFIAGFGSAAQQAALLPGLIAGTRTASVAISEPGAGAHPKHLRTTATREGDAFLLSGEKAFVTNGPIADLFIALAITAVEDGRKRYSAFIVPRDASGLSVLDAHPLGALRPSQHCGLRFSNVRVSAGNRLGPEGGAYEAMALPFRDVEDAVATSALHGALRHLLGRLAAGAPETAVESLGELAALIALIGHGAHAAAAALDAGTLGEGDAPATVIGVRTLAADLLGRIRTHRDRHGPADPMIDVILHDLEVSLSVAKGPRLVKQQRLGLSLLTPPPSPLPQGEGE